MPVLLLFMMGVICYGGYFWLAHDVQQLANNAARAAIAGLDATERSTLAKSTVNRDLGQSESLDTPRALVSIREMGGAVTVTVSYDASNSAFWVLLDMLPLPSQTIRRSATVSLGGY